MERDSLKSMLYSFARFGLYFLINIFGVIMAKVFIRSIGSFLVPRLQLHYNDELLSFFSFLIPLALFIALFADDAKRHTAYGTYNMTLIGIVMILTSAVYYIPVLLMPHIDDKATLLAIENMYFSGYWLSLIDTNIEIYALIEIIIYLIACICTYAVARKIYVKKFDSGEYEYLYDR